MPAFRIPRKFCAGTDERQAIVVVAGGGLGAGSAIVTGAGRFISNIGTVHTLAEGTFAFCGG